MCARTNSPKSSPVDAMRNLRKTVVLRDVIGREGRVVVATV